MRLGIESLYSMTNSRNLKEVQPRDSPFVTLAAFKHLLRRAISLSVTSTELHRNILHRNFLPNFVQTWEVQFLMFRYD